MEQSGKQIVHEPELRVLWFESLGGSMSLREKLEVVHIKSRAGRRLAPSVGGWQRPYWLQ